MRLLDAIERPGPQAVTWSPIDDFWYTPLGQGSETFAGFPIGPDTALRVSTVFACNSLILETVASLPCILYRRTAEGGKERATDHRWYRPIRYQPNAWMTAMDFFGFGQGHLGLRGTFVAEIKEGFRGEVALHPLHPTTVVATEQTANGRVRVRHRNPKTGEERTLTQDQVLIVRDTSQDGLVGQARATLAREAIAVAAAAEAGVARYFKYDATGRLIFKFPRALGETQRAAHKKMIDDTVAGWQHNRRPMYVDDGATVDEIGGPDNATFLIDPRKFQVADIARFWRVPSFMIGLEEKSTSWGTGIEQQKQGFVDFTVRPWLVRWEQALARDLLLDEEREEFFFEFLLDGLLRGDIASTVAALAIEEEHGAVTQNEWRIIRNRNPVPGGDTFRETPPGTAPNRPTPAPRPAKDDEDEEDEEAHVRAAPLLADAAGRLAAAEVRAVEKKAPKAAGDGLKFLAWGKAFYAEHRTYAERVLEPIAQALGHEPWVASEAAKRIEATGFAALTVSGIPEGWAAQREAELRTLLDETFRAACAVRRAA